MSSAMLKSDPTRDNLLLSFFSALLIVLFLFFIDEGYYDFRWMLEWGNWIVFFIYLAFLFPVQWLIARYLFRKVHGNTKALLMLFIGTPLTLALFFLILFYSSNFSI